MTTSDKITKRARAITLELGEYNQRDAISILAAAISMITLQPKQAKDQLGKPFTTPNAHLLRKGPGRISRIENDTEIKTFITNLDRYYTGSELLAAIENCFGKERTPSKSGLGRYLQKISKTN